MRIQNLLVPAFVLIINAARLDERQGTVTVDGTPTASGALAPARTMDFTSELTSLADPDLDSSVGDDENGSPDTEDIAWVNAFLDGEPVDELLDFNTHDLIEDDDSDSNEDDSADSDTTSNAVIATLTQNRSKTAFARAHWRARRRTAGLSWAGPPAAQDHEWAEALISGQQVDDDLIWDSADLDDPADNPADDVQLVSAANFNNWAVESAAMALSTNTTAFTTLLAKRRHYKHKPRNALQVLRRYQRAARRARHRARVRKNKRALAKLKRAAHARKVREMHRQQVAAHKAKVNSRKALNRIAHAKHLPKPPRYPPQDYKPDGKLRHGVKKCGHPEGYGMNCDGSIDCHFWCVRGIQNCAFDSAC